MTRIMAIVKSLFSCKDIQQLLIFKKNNPSQLKRSLHTLDVMLLGIGAIIGAGIFTTIGTAAAGDAMRPGAGPSLILSFLLTAFTCGLCAMCYAELASMVPLAGSAYTYTYASLGELTAWIIGWDLMLEYAISNIAVAISWAHYFDTFLRGVGIHLPRWLVTDYRSALQLPELLAQAPKIGQIPIVFNLLAFSITFVLTILLVWGIRESVRLNTFMVVFKCLILIFFVAAGLSHSSQEQLVHNWQPFFPHGIQGTLAAAAVVFFAYIGFDTVSTVAEETHQPERTLPLAIIGSLLVCALFYVVVAAVFTGIVPKEQLIPENMALQEEPLALALSYVAIQKPWIATLIALGASIAQTVTLLVYQLGQPRIFYAMSRDGLLPKCFAAIHPRYQTPHISTILTGALVAIFSTFARIDELIDLTNIGTLAAFALVSLSIPILRYTDPQRPRSFQVPFGPYLIPLLAVGFCSFLIIQLPQQSYTRFIGWLGIGLGVYLIYGYQHSLQGLQQQRPKIAKMYLYSSGFLVIALSVYLMRWCQL